MQNQRVGGDLHNDGIRSLRAHPPEQRLQIRGLRGRPLRLPADPLAPVLDRADHPDPAAAGSEHRFSEIAHRGLPVGPRDPREAQLTRWRVVKASRHMGQGAPRLSDLEDGPGDRWPSG